jgi:peptidyl-tRNA hydrolase, PTH1 family
VPSFVRLIVGLGNPGERYRDTWHNLGARTVELLAQRAGTALRPGRGESLMAEASVGGLPVMLMVPTSYMNRSGGPVALWLNYYKAPPEELLVIYDDHDIALGRLRLRATGTSGGHRGMEDIIQLLGSTDFPRIRIGIRTEREHPVLADQVLAPIPRVYADTVDNIISAAANAAESVVLEGITEAANRYNGMDFIDR